MLKVEHQKDYLKGDNLEVTEPVEKEQNTQQSSDSFQPKFRVRRQYDSSVVELFFLISKHGNGDTLKKNEDVESIANLLNKVDINYKDGESDTFLHAAVKEGHEDIIKLLLDKQGININIQNNRGDTPIHIAVCKSRSNIVDLLLKKGADIMIENAKGNTTLDIANASEDKKIIKKIEDQIINNSLEILKDRLSRIPTFSTEEYQKFIDATFSKDYEKQLVSEDINNILKFKYIKESDKKMFEAIQLGELGNKLENNSNTKQKIFIVDLGNLHWITLVIFSKNQLTSYYVDPLKEEVHQDIKSKLGQKNIEIKSLDFEQKKEKFNSGIFALKSAEEIVNKLDDQQSNAKKKRKEKVQLQQMSLLWILN